MTDTETRTLQDNVDLIRYEGRSFFIVGTAHVSQKSVELTERIIREVRPESVAVELCESRFQSLKNPDRWKNTDIVTIIRSGKAYVLLAQLLLASFQKKLGAQLNIKPGAEMMRAVSLADEVGARTVLADRDVTTTLKRTWAGLGLWSTMKIFWAMLAGILAPQRVDEAEIERLKNGDALDELMREFSHALPEVRETLIDERDRYLAEKIRSAPGDQVVAIVGAGHVPGIKKYFGSHVDIAKLESVPPPSLLFRSLGWLIPLIVIAVFAYGFIGGGSEKVFEMAWVWIIITGSSAALGSALCLAHPLTIAVAFLSSPLTTLHPLLASGWFAGLMEAVIRKPRVSDLETVADDLASLKGFWNNRLGKILLIMALTNLTGTLGVFWAIKVLGSMT